MFLTCLRYNELAQEMGDLHLHVYFLWGKKDHTTLGACKLRLVFKVLPNTNGAVLVNV